MCAQMCIVCVCVLKCVCLCVSVCVCVATFPESPPQACRYLKMQKDGQLSVAKKKYKDEKSSAVDILFDREKVTGILCTVRELQGQEALLGRVVPTDKG